MKNHQGLKTILKKHSGRDNTGTVSMRHQGGRQKRYHRLVDNKRYQVGQKSRVIAIEYDPNRTADLALIEDKSGQRRYIICPADLKIGMEVNDGDQNELDPGNTMMLQYIPVGTEIHNLELYPGKGGQIVKSAGSVATVIAKDEKYAHVKLPSREIRRIQLNCRATVGRIGNIDHKLEIIGKAGRKRLMGIRPTVRGVAQNPHSHPHGGGEGRSGQGMHSKTKWGKPAFGKKTRNKKRINKFIMTKRK